MGHIVARKPKDKITGYVDPYYRIVESEEDAKIFDDFFDACLTACAMGRQTNVNYVVMKSEVGE